MDRFLNYFAGTALQHAEKRRTIGRASRGPASIYGISFSRAADASFRQSIERFICIGYQRRKVDKMSTQ